jgi:hypothetical protein
VIRGLRRAGAKVTEEVAKALEALDEALSSYRVVRH